MELNRQELNDWENIFNSLAQEGGDLSAEITKEGIQELIAKYNRLDVEAVVDLSVSAHNDVLSEFGTTACLSSEEMFTSLAEKSNIDAISSYYDVKDIINQDIVRQAFKNAFFENLKGALKDANVDGYLDATKNIFSNSIHICQRETMLKNADKNGQRVARVTSGAKPCSYCYMLSSRGFVYHSEETAIASGHVHCNCTLITGKPGDKIAGYNYETRKEVMETIGEVCGVDLSRGIDKLTKKEREKVDLFHSFLSEQYLFDGTPGEFICDEETLRFKIANTSKNVIFSREKHSISKLYPFGINGDFQIDEYREKGIGKIGLPDLKNGIDIKTAYELNSYLSIARHIEKSIHKRGLKCIYFDFSENHKANKNNLISWTKDAKRKHKCVPLLIFLPGERIPKLFM